MLLLEARLLDGSSFSVPPLGTLTVMLLEPRLRMTPLTLTSTVMVVPTLTTAVSPAPGEPVGLQRVVSDQLYGRLPFVVVYVVASAAGAPAKRMATTTTARTVRLTPIETASRLGPLRCSRCGLRTAPPAGFPPEDDASRQTSGGFPLRASGPANTL